MIYHFNFGQFEPSQKLKTLSTRLLEGVLEGAPSDSTTVAGIKRRQNKFEAVIEIFSQAGHFIAQSLEETPELALHKLKEGIEERLSQWRRSRFVGEAEDQPNNFPNTRGQPGGTYGEYPY